MCMWHTSPGRDAKYDLLLVLQLSLLNIDWETASSLRATEQQGNATDQTRAVAEQDPIVRWLVTASDYTISSTFPTAEINRVSPSQNASQFHSIVAFRNYFYDFLFKIKYCGWDSIYIYMQCTSDVKRCTLAVDEILNGFLWFVFFFFKLWIGKPFERHPNGNSWIALTLAEQCQLALGFITAVTRCRGVTSPVPAVPVM